MNMSIPGLKKLRFQPKPGESYVISHEEREKGIELYLYTVPIPLSVSNFFRKLIEKIYDVDFEEKKYQLLVKRGNENVGRMFFVGSGDKRVLKTIIKRANGKRDRLTAIYQKVRPRIMRVLISSPYEVKSKFLSEINKLEEEYKQLR